MTPRSGLSTRTSALLGGMILAWVCSASALADDTEVFLNQAAVRGVKPNVLFIVDTSASMDALVRLPKRPYDARLVYPGNCSTADIYVTRAVSGTAPPPACDGAVRRINVADNLCAAAQVALTGPAGFWTGKAARWDEERVGWRNLQFEMPDGPVECEADAGRHGRDSSSPKRWARSGDAGNRWTATPAEAVSWSATDVYTFYSANYLNWRQSPDEPTELSRLQVVQSVGTAIAHSIDSVNLGLMRFSSGTGQPLGAEGGMVTHEIADLTGARGEITRRLNEYTTGWWTPLSETLYEAGQYLAGRPVDYGVNSIIDSGTPSPSVPGSREATNPSVYRSPVEYQCQRNFVVLLTDGEPVEDSSADDKIASLPGFANLGRATCDGEGEGRCLDDMAEYLNTAADLSPSLPGRQSASTYTIGFGEQVAGSAFLDKVAQRGGGRAFAATDVNGLTEALQSIFGDILQTGATFVSPAVSINAFNRTQTNNELYVSVFKPDDTQRWRGNVKKYALRSGRIVDVSGAEAVDPMTGFLRSGSRSLWSSAPENDVVEDGGAVSRLPAPGQRRLLTHFPEGGSAELTASGNAFDAGNAALTDALLNTGGDGPSRAQVIDWARGVDTADLDFDGDRTETLATMGDPLHARPAVVAYGGSAGSPDAADAVVFVPTNDGFIHALDARTGQELWAFIPHELLGRLVDLYRNPSVATRDYGLDAEVRVLKFDANDDGVVDAAAGDKVWLFFGMRRGGRQYYAIDVTDRNRPRLKWNLGPAQLPGIGETWSTPTIARIRIQGARQNGENLVLVFGGGYDDAQESYQYATDSSGNRVFMVDASSGELLWFAGGGSSSRQPDLNLVRMTHSIPGRVVALDTDGDQYADRLYAGDMGGRVWRFDVWNGRGRGELVTGGVLASLGAADTERKAIADNRRFYSAPDVALIQRRGADPYFNIAIGSGYRGHPLHTETRDRFYSIRDRNPFGRLTQAQYDAATPVTDASLTDITDDPAAARVPASAPGWKLEMRLNGGWSGEKILAEATTINGTVLFTSYQPTPQEASDPCLPANGINRAYALRVDSGRPAVDFNEDEAIDATDISMRLTQSGIAGEVSIAVESATRGGTDEATATEGTDALGRRGFCVVGVEVLRRCVVPGGLVRTYWQRNANNSAD